MRKIFILLLVIVVSATCLKAQNYFLKEIQNNSANDVKSGYKYRIVNYIDSLEQAESKEQVFEGDSAKRAYYQQKILNINFIIKHYPDSPENYIFKAIYKSALYEYDSAEILLNMAIDIDPNYAEAYVERGVLYLTRYEVKKAISDFKTALKINPQYTDAIYNLGFVYFQQGKYDKAIEYFEDAVNQFSYHYQSYIQLGYLYFIKQDYAKSEENYNMAIEIKPYEPAGYNLRGQMYLYKNEIEKAKSDYEKSLSIDPSNYSVMFILGSIEMNVGDLGKGIEIVSKGTRILNNFTFADRIGDYDEAEINDIIVNYESYTKNYSEEVKQIINQCLKGILENESLYKVYYNLNEIIKKDNSLILPKRLELVVLFKTGQIVANFEKIDDLLEKDSSLPYVYLLKGNVLVWMNKYMEAINCYNKVIELQPNYSYGYAARSWARHKQGRIESALVDIEQSLKDVTPYLYAINVNAVLLNALNKHEESIELTNIAINYFPDQAFLYTNRALTYLRLHDKEKALEDCNKAIEIDINFAASYSTRGVVYMTMGEHTKALKDFDKALEIEPGNINAIHEKARAFVELDQSEKAIELYTSYLDKGINVKDFYFGLSQIYYNKDDFNKAIDNATKVIELDRTYFYAYILRAGAKFKLDRIDDALNDLDRVLEIDSTNIAAIGEKAIIYSENNEIEKSTQEYLKLIAIDSTSNVPYGNIGWNYYLLGQYEECIKWSEIAIKKDKEAFYAICNIALSYLCMGEFEKSKQIYQEYYEYNMGIEGEIHDGTIQDLRDIIEKGLYVEEAQYILKNIFKVEIE